MPKKPRGPLLEVDKPALDTQSIKRSLANRLMYSIGKDPITATERDWFYSAASVVRERFIERWMETMRSYYREDTKRVYYFSMEFLMGRTLMNGILNVGCDEAFRQAMHEMGLELEKIREIDRKSVG